MLDAASESCPHRTAATTVAVAARRWAAVALCLITLAANPASAGPPRYKPLADPADGNPDLALFVFVVDAPYGVGQVTLADADGRVRATLVIDSKAGEYTVRFYALPPGTYHLAAMTAPDLQREPYEIHEAPAFAIVPARLNYGGDLELYREHEDLYCRLRNRSGRLVTHLREDRSAFLNAKPLAYVGDEDDEWTDSLGSKAR